ncbi:MAG: rhodanese-like domain-containing protein [Clostridia bacterium]|nr:rhodanese-like domain-containing protein [Clostridia bacterium]
MKKIALALAVILCFTCLCACNDEPTQYFVTQITSDEAKTMIDTGEYVILDVRSQEEYDEKHIPGSVLVTIDKTDVEPFKTAVQQELTDKDAKIIVYCKSGFRSDIAAKAMSTLGYNNLYNMTDGIDGWKYEAEPVR